MTRSPCKNSNLFIPTPLSPSFCTDHSTSLKSACPKAVMHGHACSIFT
uniref:Uncharacterized protein n=1 Tax=Nelumbo nucifera TaxID=4432 RepID=A0A822ZXV6_NELNU|nr:TPA_asm: hypothetical protein HUJ06_017613 [Nelumbo nucifera]